MATQTQYFDQTIVPRERAKAEQKGSVFGIDASRLATGLGWFSIGLGAMELLAPKTIGRITGMTNHRSTIRGYGVREIVSGIGILTRPQPVGSVWSRVAGDVMDLASLGVGLTSQENERGKTVGAIAAVLGVTALDVLCAQQLSRAAQSSVVKATAIVNLPPEQCYAFWRNLENHPRFMKFIQSVRVTEGNRSHWVASVPAQGSVEWDAEITDDVPNRKIAWKTLPGSQVNHSGSVEFNPAPGGRGTMVALAVDFEAGQVVTTLGQLGKLVGNDPESVLEKNLKGFKRLIETGELITTEGQSAGNRNGATWLDHIAR